VLTRLAHSIQGLKIISEVKDQKTPRCRAAYAGAPCGVPCLTLIPVTWPLNRKEIAPMVATFRQAATPEISKKQPS